MHLPRSSWVAVLAATALIACALPPEELGSVTMDLRSTSASGVEYRLVNATLTFDGPETVVATTDPNAETVERDLLPGAYWMTLEDGWVLQRNDGTGFVDVEGVLLEANPKRLAIIRGEVTQAVLRFGVGDDFIEFGHGRVRVGIDVEESPPYGGTVTFAFSATVTFSDHPSIAVVGDTITGTYTFDILAPDGRGEPTYATYYFDHQPGEFEMEVHVNTLTLRTEELDPHNFSTAISVRDDSLVSSTAPWDRYSVITRELVASGVGGFTPDTVDIQLATLDNLSAIDSTALPIEPPPLSAFSGGSREVTIRLRDETSPFALSRPIRGELTSLTRVDRTTTSVGTR
ncbi:MAG: hypothetical protein R3B82_03150 [Sandaracinaceae bacterium]